MLPQEKFHVLLVELEKFYGDDIVALTHDNWALLRALSIKKLRHLNALQCLAPQVDRNAETKMLLRIRERSRQARELLEKKYLETKGRLDKLKNCRFKIRSVKTYLKTSKKNRKDSPVGTNYA
jgi:hypothetical protein